MEWLCVVVIKYLVFDICREVVIEDVFNQLWRREERELLRLFKVCFGEFMGEEGFDLGGVQQEFFCLVLVEVLNLDYGVFMVDERSWMVWFVFGLLEDEWKFELIGLFVFFVVYNGLMLLVMFLKVFYCKLFGKLVDKFCYIVDGWLDIVSLFMEVEQWDDNGLKGKFEDFCIMYDFFMLVFGYYVIREMWLFVLGGDEEGGDWDIYIFLEEEWFQFFKIVFYVLCNLVFYEYNLEEEFKLVIIYNRDEYIVDYICYLIMVFVCFQFEVFVCGFCICFQFKFLFFFIFLFFQLFVEGVQEIDIFELKCYVKYIGYDEYYWIIKDFWLIVKRYDEDMKRKLFEFVMVSDWVFVGGMKYVVFNIQKNGVENDELGLGGMGNRGRLLMSYICYSMLLLFEYKDKEMLRERLGMVLENVRGFGFVQGYDQCGGRRC